jgi:hypothetical protein
MVLVESKDGWVVKVPALSNSDHLTLLKEPSGVGKHITDEQDKSVNRHSPLGKITSGTPRPAMRFYEERMIELAADAELYVFDLASILGGGGPTASDIPSSELPIDASWIEALMTIDLSAVPLLRRTTVAEARKSGFVAGFRRVGSENVAVLQLASGRVLQLTPSEFFSAGAETARVVGVGELMGRAKRRRLAEEAARDSDALSNGIASNRSSKSV